MGPSLFAAVMTAPPSWVSLARSDSVAYNFDALDAVFFDACPICATNLKTMWCEYACNPDKANFSKYERFLIAASDVHWLH